MSANSISQIYPQIATTGTRDIISLLLENTLQVTDFTNT